MRQCVRCPDEDEVDALLLNQLCVLACRVAADSEYGPDIQIAEAL